MEELYTQLHRRGWNFIFECLWYYNFESKPKMVINIKDVPSNHLLIDKINILKHVSVWNK